MDSINNTIAEACGWKNIGYHGQEQGWLGDSPDGHWQYSVPDYVNDLNAMHEAEKTIPLTRIKTYREHLETICTHREFSSRNIKVGPVTAISATAAQRAEAFLKTMRLTPH